MSSIDTPTSANSSVQLSTVFGWIDFSADDRDRVNTVLDILATPGTVDELGIGTIRDAIADSLFPGISTIQTRAKYFLLVPRLVNEYRQLNHNSREKQSLSEFLEKKERLIRATLVAKHRPDKEGKGIIGSSFGEKLNQGVQRLPSSTYWHGLRVLGLIPDLPLRTLGDTLRQSGAQSADYNYGEEDNADNRLSTVSDKLPYLKPIVLDELSIELTRDEAELLRPRIISNLKNDTLLAWLLTEEGKKFLPRPAKRDSYESSYIDFKDKLPENIRENARIGYHFSRAMRGAHILYNVLLQGDSQANQDRINLYKEHFNDWSKLITEEVPSITWVELSKVASQQGRKVKLETSKFIEGWLHVCEDPNGMREKAKDLVRRQEVSNKGALARLSSSSERERPTKQVGLESLNYRLPQAIQIVSDIHDALTPGWRPRPDA